MAFLSGGVRVYEVSADIAWPPWLQINPRVKKRKEAPF